MVVTPDLLLKRYNVTTAVGRASSNTQVALPFLSVLDQHSLLYNYIYENRSRYRSM